MSKAAEFRSRVRDMVADQGRVATGLALGQLGAKAGPMAVRGLALRPALGSASGLLLVGRGARIRNPQYVHLGGNVVVEDYAEVQGLSTDGVHLGAGVTVGRFAQIRPSGYYGRDVGVGLRVGDDSNIGPGCFIGCSGGIEIGRGVMMSPGVNLFAENHVIADAERPMKEQGVKWDRIVVEDDVWLASGSTVLAGVTVGTGAVVAAGAVVTTDVPAGAIVGGVPARVVSWRSPQAQAAAEAG